MKHTIVFVHLYMLQTFRNAHEIQYTDLESIYLNKTGLDMSLDYFEEIMVHIKSYSSERVSLESLVVLSGVVCTLQLGILS